MSADSIIAATASGACALLVVLALVRKWRALASWSFAAGMTVFAAETAFAGLALRLGEVTDVLFWQRLSLIAGSFLPAPWLCFSLTYSRGNAREFLAKWKYALLVALVVPVGLAISYQSQLLRLAQTDSGESWLALGWAGRALSVLLLIAGVLIISNLEKTLRAAVGIMRWRIKFLVLGLGVIFISRIYVESQTLLFSNRSVSLTPIESSSLLVGCGLMAVGYWRSGFSNLDVYPSQAILQGSVTMLIVGGYLFVVGVLAQVVAAMGGVRHFQAQAFLVLLALAGLGLLLLSDRFRQRRRRFVSRHFRRPQHDFRKVWTLFTERTSTQFDERSLCAAVARLLCETFDVLSVTIWLAKEGEDHLTRVASTSQTRPEGSASDIGDGGIELSSLIGYSTPFAIETLKEPWAVRLRELNPRHFPHGGERIALPLLSGQRWIGVAVITDRVSGLPYTAEEMDLLKCIGDQLGASLLNLRLGEENLRAKEMEAFQTLSAFFVHDLKNAASGLNLTLQNLPVHFDDPAFREDALRGIAGTVDRINQLISRLSLLKGKFEMHPVELDLNQLIAEVIKDLDGPGGIKLETQFLPLPPLLADRDQLESVIRNLVLNAHEAVNGDGRIQISTSRSEDVAVLSISDNGCGMGADFVRDSLFRPFHSTKKKGLGIGMFQTRAIIQAHRGSIRVESELHKGSTFRIHLPITGPNT
jgi:putative PEP-CTERM system histidine kinase